MDVEYSLGTLSWIVELGTTAPFDCGTTQTVVQSRNGSLMNYHRVCKPLGRSLSKGTNNCWYPPALLALFKSSASYHALDSDGQTPPSPPGT